MNMSSKIRLRSEIYCEKVGLLQGFLTDITDGKATLCLQRNLDFSGQIKLRVHFYPLSTSEKPKSVDIDGCMRSMIYSSQYEDFRTEVQFTKFFSEDDRRFFKSRL